MPETSSFRTGMAKDAAFFFLYLLILAALGWRFDTDQLAQFLTTHFGSKLDELGFGSFAVTLGMLVFSVRRWMEMKSALAREEHFEIEHAKAEAVSRSKSDFLANMSHE